MTYRSRSMTVALGIVAVAFAICAPRVAAAGGFEYGTDNGALSVARAGATTALASDGSAIYTNVAGTTYADRADLYISNSLVFRALTFDPTADGPSIEDETAIFAAPMIAASIRLHPNLVLILGANGPASMGWGNFPTTVDEQANGMRYDMTRQSITYVWPSVGLGLTIPGFEDLRIAATFQPAFINLQMTSFADSGISVLGDIKVDLNLWDAFVPAGQLGILYRVWRLDIGVQLRMSAPIEAEGDVTPTLTGDRVDDADRVRPDVRGTFTFNWPMAVLRTGVRYGHPANDGDMDSALPHRRERFDVELDFIYENTSGMNEYELTLHDPVNLQEGLDVALPPRSVPHNWQDSFSLRLGGSINLLGGDLSIHWGASWENDSVPEDYTRLDYASWMRIGVALGATYRINWFEVTLAYQHIFMPDRTVANGHVCPLNGTAVEEDNSCQTIEDDGSVTNDYSSAVNNGTFTGGYDFLVLSLNFRL